jgi:hypothetical protein
MRYHSIADSPDIGVFGMRHPHVIRRNPRFEDNKWPHDQLPESLDDDEWLRILEGIISATMVGITLLALLWNFG